MSGLSKFFSIVLFGGLSFVSISALAMTTTNTEELYAENVHLERSSAEIPKSIDAGTSDAAAIQEDYVVESVNDMKDAPTAPKVSKKLAAKAKKSIKE